MYLEAQQADEEEKQYRRKMGTDREPPGETGRQELLRLLEEEIASVREEFEYAEKANEERAAIERDACLAPEGESWAMMLRQEGALDRSIDRKVRILMRLRKELTKLPIPPPGQDDCPGMENKDKVLRSDISPEDLQQVEVVGELKMKKRCGNIIENKAPLSKSAVSGGNVLEGKGSYALRAGM